MESTPPTDLSDCASLGLSEKEPQRRFFDYSGPVESISLDGATINWYTNVVEAATKTEVFEKGIKRCMKGDRITYGGLKWRRGAPQIIEDDATGSCSSGNAAAVSTIEAVAVSAPATEPIEAPPLQALKSGVSIECMTHDGIVLHRFLDIKSIRKQANFPIERIQTVLRKQQQKSAGFYWRFYDENRVNLSNNLITLEELLAYKDTALDYKLQLPSHKKVKTRYDDTTASVVSSSRSSFNSGDNSCGMKEINLDSGFEDGKNSKGGDQENDIFVSNDSLDPLSSFNATVNLDFNRAIKKSQNILNSSDLPFWKERVHEPL